MQLTFSGATGTVTGYRIEHELRWRVSVPEHRDVFDSATEGFRP